jgi:hypothetical protein
MTSASKRAERARSEPSRADRRGDRERRPLPERGAAAQGAAKRAERARSEPKASEGRCPDARSAAGAARAKRAAFTLLEVLGAVVVVGLVFVALARASIQALRAEGDAARRLEASLLADRLLGEIEQQSWLGTAPEVGTQESEEAGFSVVVDVQPYTLLDAIPPRETTRQIQRDTNAEDGRRTVVQGATLIGEQRRGSDPPLRSVTVSVRWVDGVQEREVRRSTFALDLTSVQADLEALGGQPEAQPTGEPPPSEPAPDDGTQTPPTDAGMEDS